MNPRGWPIPIFLAIAASTLSAADFPPCWPIGGILDPAQFIRKEPTDQTQKLLADLGSPDFTRRETAMHNLIDNGIDAFPGIITAAQSSDNRELQARLETLVGPLDAAAAARARQQQSASRFEAATKLLNARTDLPAQPGGGFQLPPLEGSTEPLFKSPEEHARFYEEFYARQNRLFRPLQATLQRMAPVRARLALLAGADAQSILHDALATSYDARCDYAALLWQLKGTALDPRKELDASGLMDSNERSHLALLLYRLKGDLTTASRFHTTLPPATYGIPLATIDARAYKQFADYLDRNAPDAHLGALLLARHLAGEPDQADTLARRWKVQFVPNTDTAQVALALMQGGYPKEALEVATRRPDDQDTAFHFLCQQLRIREALAQLKDRSAARIQTATHLMDLGLMEAARALLRDMQPGNQLLGKTSQATDELNYALAWERAGDPARAAQWRSRAFARVDENDVTLAPLMNTLQQLNDKIERTNDPGIDRVLRAQRELLLAQLRTLRRNSPVANFAWQNALPAGADYDVVFFWFARMWEDGIREEDRFNTAQRRARGEVTPSEARQMIDAALAADYDAALPYAMTTFRRARREDWALQLADAWEKQRSDPAGWQFVGDIALDNNQPEMAFIYYRRSALMHLTDASLLYRMGVALSRGHVAKDIGKAAMEAAPLLVLGDHEQAKKLADAMRRCEGKDAGDAWLNAWNTRFGFNNLFNGIDNFAHARDAAEARGNFHEALASQYQLMLLRLPLVPPYEGLTTPWTTMNDMAACQRLRALDALTRNDPKTLSDALTLSLSYAPPDVDLFEKTIPFLKQHDAPAAQKLLQTAQQRLHEVAEDYPSEPTWQQKWERLQKL